MQTLLIILALYCVIGACIATAALLLEKSLTGRLLKPHYTVFFSVFLWLPGFLYAGYKAQRAHR